MARYKRPTPRKFEQNPGLYQKTSDTWTTRYYQRKSDKMFDLLGLNTAPDDYHKKQGGSPYLQNIRYMGEREGEQRAQLMSRKGNGFIATSGETTFVRDVNEAQSYINIFEGRAIEWNLTHNRRLTGVSLWLKNKEQATGYLKITIRESGTKRLLANGVVNLDLVSRRQYGLHSMRFMNTVRQSNVIIRAEILDDVDNNEDRSETRERRNISILTTFEGGHQYADYELPNTDDSLREIPYVFQEGNTMPLTGTSINDWVPLKRSKEFKINGVLHMYYPVRHDGIVEIFKVNLVTKVATAVTTLVDPKAEFVRFDQAEGYMYYIDGISNLRRINIITGVAADVVPLASELQVSVDPETLRAKKGASLIKFLQNRIYLSGFKDDPNLVIYSLIDNVKPRFEQYNDRFYSPDQSPESSAGNPITALAGTANVLVVFRLADLSLYTPGAGLEISATQATPEGAALGVLNQEAVCEGKNNIFFYNPIEGVARFAGSLNRVISGDIENMLKRIKHPENVFMLYQNKRVRMYFSFTETTNDSCFYYYSDLEGKLPWYLDVNTPVSTAIADKKSESIYAVHAEVPSIIDVDSQITDFDSYIEVEYHTNWRTPDSPDGWVYVRRTHVHELANSTHSLYIGVDIDHKDSPVVYRRYVEQTTDPEVNPDAVFQHTSEDGIEVISIPMYLKCRTYQVRLKRYCYKDIAEILGVSVEYGNKDAI